MKPTLKTSLLKLALVGMLFYASYGLSNHYAASLAYVPEVAFAWERNIPFWEWTILPYWSLNLMYAAAFFLCRNAREQNRYVARLVSAQIVATTCFMLFPLHFGWPKPPTDGLWGVMFDSLVAFDLPYNQSPSLHIALSIIVGAFYWTRFPKIRLPIFLWQSLIALSVLTTYQHHFIDVPTGALLGWLVLWAIPQHGVSPFRRPFDTQGRLKTSEASFCEANTGEAIFCEAKTSAASPREANTGTTDCRQPPNLSQAPNTATIIRGIGFTPNGILNGSPLNPLGWSGLLLPQWADYPVQAAQRFYPLSRLAYLAPARVPFEQTISATELARQAPGLIAVVEQRPDGMWHETQRLMCRG